jgi:SAM-dependent methyltransferase
MTSSEEDFALQRKVFRKFRHGPDPEEIALCAVAELAPKDVLEVGPGDGTFAEQVAQVVGAKVIAVDISPQMVELTRLRGIEAQLGDVEDLPFPAAYFDCVVANWMLYLASDVDRAVYEIARVLRPGGRLVAGAVASESFAEIRELLGGVEPHVYSFSAESGSERLTRHFRHIGRRDVEGSVVFPDWKVLRDFVALAPDRASLVTRTRPFSGSFTTRSRLAIFVADK